MSFMDIYIESEKLLILTPIPMGSQPPSSFPSLVCFYRCACGTREPPPRPFHKTCHSVCVCPCDPGRRVWHPTACHPSLLGVLLTRGSEYPAGTPNPGCLIRPHWWSFLSIFSVLMKNASLRPTGIAGSPWSQNHPLVPRAYHIPL